MKKQTKTMKMVSQLREAGIPYRDIAARCQVKVGTVRNYKCGSQSPGKFPAEKICLMVMEIDK